ncbi:MAG: DUF342 domain-containing protein [Sulfurospirillum sp.]|nr:DUF342 domain-containing protein [Sulfurospirillum sp.]
MGLFDKIAFDDNSNADEQKDAKPEFKSVILESENIPREIKSIANVNALSVDALDFKILKCKTLYSDTKEEGWVEADTEKIKLFESEDFLLNPALKIKQSFKVEIFKKNEEEESVLPHIMLSDNKLLTRVIANIKQNIEVKYVSKLEELIVDEINKKKIKAGVFVGIHDANLYKEVKKIVASIRINGILDKDYSFLVCECIDPVFPINDDLKLYYKKKVKQEDDQGRIDYSKRGYILAVDVDECIIEYIKPKDGKAGRNCQGKYLGVANPKIEHEIIINTTENIIKKEDESSIRYIAQRCGYVVETGLNTFDIDDRMEVTEVSFRTTGSIETSMSSNVKINIQEADIFKDAIGPGMSVETSELNVQGNVGSGARIKANKLEVGGQTHKTSVIEAKNAHIMTHRGELSGETILVDRLEGGHINGVEVHVKQAIGGEIIAKNIIIDELISNVHMSASDKIEIKELKGNSNKFIIDPSVTIEFNEKIAKINEEIKDLTIKIKPLPTQLDDRKKLLEKTKPTINMIKDKITELKGDGKKPPAALLMKIRDFQGMVSAYNDLLANYKNQKAKIEDLRADLKEVQLKIFSAKIVNHSPWLEFNEIRFKLISPTREIIYNTKNHEIIREITLKQVGDEEFKINKSSEYSAS